MRSTLRILLLWLASGLVVSACSSVDEKPANQSAVSSRAANNATAVAAQNSAANRVEAENEVVPTDPVGNIKKKQVG